MIFGIAELILAESGDGIARAERKSPGNWTVDFTLEGEQVNCLVADHLTSRFS
jgi:hypothetical protein